MAKRRRERKVEHPSPSPVSRPPQPSISPDRILHIENQMRGLLEAARAPRARRFVTPSKVQSRINEIIRSEVSHVQDVRRRSRNDKRLAREVQSQLPKRSPLHHSELLQRNLPQQVRDILLDSERALECTRRETRREVLFSMRRTGKGGKNNRQAKWTANSYISCKR